jgi:adenylate cyclase
VTPTHFDIYVRQGGRWRRHETLAGNDKEAVILRSSEINDNGGFDGVRAMAVVEYGSGRAPLETLAWISPHLNKMANVKRQMQNSVTMAGKSVAARTGGEASELSDENPDLVASFTDEQVAPQNRQPPPPEVKGNPHLRATGKIVLAGGIALGVTAVFFVPLSALIRSVGANFGLSAAFVQNAILLVTALLFVSLATFLMMRVYREYRDLMEEIAAYEPPPPKRKATIHPDVIAAERAKRNGIETASPEPAAAPEGGSEPGPENSGLSEAMRRAVLQFLASALAAIKDEVPTMNQHVSFGLNLFGAGAAERYGEHAGLKRFQAFVLVREVVEALGNTQERVDSFCRNYEGYRAEERFRMMINAGRKTMARSIKGDARPFEDFADVVKMWTSDSAARAQAQGIVCIMFTDLVGSTQMTHERGDYGAQEIVRIHNAIVRSALAGHHGREVKHTGDGIMASFSSAANAVRAAVQIRESLAEHNARDDTLAVRVRMGLNAGEAVQEEDDFFGTTVQLSARVCDKADEGEIFVTDNVRELSKGQGLTFDNAGQYEMKGVPEPMTLYRVGKAAADS